MRPDQLERLMESVEALHDRFGYPSVPITLQLGRDSVSVLIDRNVFLLEEVDELRHETTEPFPDLDDLAEEAVDVLYVILGTLLLLPKPIVSAAIVRVVGKNGAKTPETHHLAEDGKIRRRQ